MLLCQQEESPSNVILPMKWPRSSATIKSSTPIAFKASHTQATKEVSLLFSLWMNTLSSCVSHKAMDFYIHMLFSSGELGRAFFFFFLNSWKTMQEGRWSWHWRSPLSTMQGMPINVTGSYRHRTNGEQTPHQKQQCASVCLTVLIPDQILNSNIN